MVKRKWASQCAGFREALAALSQSQKTSKGAPAYSRYVNRPVGRVLAAGAHVIGRTPNQVTLVSAMLTMSAIALIALVRPSVLSAFGVALLLAAGYAFDAADGQLARLRGGGSASGEWLDHTVDAWKIATLHLAVLINWYRFGEWTDLVLLIPLGYQAVATIQFFTMILMDQMRRAHRGTTQTRMQGDGSSSRLYSFAVLPTDYGLLCIVFVFMFWSRGFVWLYGLLFAANAAFLILALPKWYREIGTFDQGSRR